MSYVEDFLNKIKPVVIMDMQKTGILASLTAAQAILESGWGRSELAVKANNLFGIKGSYNGQSYTVKTKEYVNGKWIMVDAAFRKYPSWQEGVNDHSHKFLTMDRYANLRGCKDYKLACKYVYEDGYATGIDYTPKLIQIIERYKLYEWDKEVTGSEVVTMAKKSSLATLSVDFGNNLSNARTQKVTKITPHHMAVITTDPARVAKVHLQGSRQASANYYIAGGKICSGVSEDRRAWTSSSSWNDQQAITFEVANCSGDPDWKVSDQDYQALVKLCADVCNRYGIIPHYDGTKNGTITVHRLYSNTGCPGRYLMNKIASLQFEKDILAAMGKINTPSSSTPQPSPQTTKIYRVQVGAFRDKKNADACAETMKRLGEKVYIATENGLYKVQVGAYSIKKNADAHVEKLKAIGIQAFVC